MFQTRARIFIIIVAVLLTVCVIRLAQMQLIPDPALFHKIEKLKTQQSKLLTTARGRIFDRKGEILAHDEPYFELQADYKLTKWMDEDYAKALISIAGAKSQSGLEINKEKSRIKIERARIDYILKKAEQFGLKRQNALEIMKKQNSRIWKLRKHLAWKRTFHDSNSLELAEPDEKERFRLILKVDISEMHDGFALLELDDDDAVFAAQKEFADIEEVEIVPKNRRVYPYNSTACHIIGWVGPESQRDLFKDDPQASYLEGEISGRPPGAEYICETILRGKRGQVTYDIDQELVSETQTQLGRDVALSIDIKLQQKIEDRIYNCELNPNCHSPTAIAVIELASGDILALVSTPTYNLNLTRYEYGDLLADKSQPLIDRTINAHYPPGSVAKVLILIAGMESGKISSGEVINCPPAPAPQGWPNCWIYNRFRRGHDDSWSNYARNAIKGSCNIYFSRLANRIEPKTLQKWFWQFGCGHNLALEPLEILQQPQPRYLSQASGIISSINPTSKAKDFSDIPNLRTGELRYFAIGQGNFRVTPLQVANAMAAIARKGLYKQPRLFLNPSGPDSKSVSLNISPHTCSVLFDGMGAVVSETGGTAYREFQKSIDKFTAEDVKIYGKTGSTQAPEHAWFGGFAMDKTGKGIAIAVLVEGGQHGSDDAAPLARDTVQFCVEAGYLGKFIASEQSD